MPVAEIVEPCSFGEGSFDVAVSFVDVKDVLANFPMIESPKSRHELLISSYMLKHVHWSVPGCISRSKSRLMRWKKNGYKRWHDLLHIRISHRKF